MQDRSPVQFETGLTYIAYARQKPSAHALIGKGHLEDTEEEETLHPEDHQRNYKDHQHHKTHASINDAT